MHGVFIENGLSDWQILQHKNGSAEITLSGTYLVPKAAIKQGVASAQPMARIMSEDDNVQIIPWTDAEYETDDTVNSGSWSIRMTVPAGGLYRVETGLKVVSTLPNVQWTFRGDTRLHFGVGDVFMIAGQSNSAGYGKDTAFDPPQLGVHLYRNRHAWDIASHPMNESGFGADAPNAEMGVSGVSPYLAFGKRFSALSHYPVGLIATAMGGMPMKRWNPDGGPLYKNMLAQAKACGPIAGVLWYQGCSDTNERRAPEYKEKYYQFIDAFRRDLGYPVTFFTFQLNRQINGENDPGWGMVREAQRTAAHDFQELYILPTLNCSLSDGIHNNAHSCMLIGERMARLCANVLYGTPEFFAPEITSATLRQQKLTLTFDHVQRGFAMSSDLPEDSGFTVRDEQGEIPLQDRLITAQNTVTLTLSREVAANATVSFAWQSNPTTVLLTDEVTYLPPLSFYEYPITIEQS